MKKLLVLFFFSFGLGYLLVSSITYANQTNISTYYPSPSGTYTKVRLMNQPGQGVPDEANFCLQTGTDQNGPIYDPKPVPGKIYMNAGTIFADPNTRFLEICKADGSAASYPGSCFNRYGPAITKPPCPANYLFNKASETFLMGGANIVSWTCCFAGPNNGNTSFTKSGCFSIYSTTAQQIPASCDSADVNAYDIGCDSIGGTSDLLAITYKRNCCYNGGPGPGYTLVHSSTINGVCTQWDTCKPSPAGSGTQTCLASTVPQCGGVSAKGQTQQCTPPPSCSGDTPCGSPTTGCTAKPSGACDCVGHVNDCSGRCNGARVLDPNGGCCLPSAEGCDGICDSGLVNDACGKCGGPGIPPGFCDCLGDVLSPQGTCP